eukprot:gene12427-13712_t
MDSPGFSATKGSYTVMDYATKKLITMEVGDKRELAKKKRNEDLAPWIAPIRNHFWYCCRSCEGSELKLKLPWSRLLHHLCGDHDYCDHGELEEKGPNEERQYLSSKEKTMQQLRAIILDPKWLKSMPKYVRNRHTGMLEAFHSLILEYCPKRIGYKHDAFTSRYQLAYIDYNHHSGRSQMKTKGGELVYMRKWGKRTKNWHVVPVAEPKKYNYIKGTISNINGTLYPLVKQTESF